MQFGRRVSRETRLVMLQFTLRKHEISFYNCDCAVHDIFPFCFTCMFLSHPPVLVPRNTRFGLCSVDLRGTWSLSHRILILRRAGKTLLAGVQWHQATSGAECILNLLKCMIPGLKRFILYNIIYSRCIETAICINPNI